MPRNNIFDPHKDITNQTFIISPVSQAPTYTCVLVPLAGASASKAEFVMEIALKLFGAIPQVDLKATLYVEDAPQSQTPRAFFDLRAVRDGRPILAVRAASELTFSYVGEGPRALSAAQNALDARGIYFEVRTLPTSEFAAAMALTESPAAVTL